MRILAIDPGTLHSGVVLWDSSTKLVLEFDAEMKNEDVCRMLYTAQADLVSIEMVAHYGKGMAVGRDVFETCIWIGEFRLIVRDRRIRFLPLERRVVKMTITGQPKAKDSNIRMGVIDRFGGELKAIGGVKCKTCKGRGMVGPRNNRVACGACGGACWTHPPGPLYELATHAWQAMALAVTAYEHARLANMLAPHRTGTAGSVRHSPAVAAEAAPGASPPAQQSPVRTDRSPQTAVALPRAPGAGVPPTVRQIVGKLPQRL